MSCLFHRTQCRTWTGEKLLQAFGFVCAFLPFPGLRACFSLFQVLIVGCSTVFTKCKSSLADGGRLENVSWRLWHREFTSVATTLKSSSFNPDLSINEKASPSQSRSHSRPLTPESTNGSDKSSVYTDEKSGLQPLRFFQVLYSHWFLFSHCSTGNFISPTHPSQDRTGHMGRFQLSSASSVYNENVKETYPCSCSRSANYRRVST